jgi:hypothetical protein
MIEFTDFFEVIDENTISSLIVMEPTGKRRLIAYVPKIWKNKQLQYEFNGQIITNRPSQIQHHLPFIVLAVPYSVNFNQWLNKEIVIRLIT